MNINTQSILENEKAILYPLQEKDFDDLYSVASDPKIWEQHPIKTVGKKRCSALSLKVRYKVKGLLRLWTKSPEILLAVPGFMITTARKTVYLSDIHSVPSAVGAKGSIIQ